MGDLVLGVRPRGFVIVCGLAAEEVEDVEATMNIVGGLELVHVVSHEVGPVPRRLHRLGERGLVVGYRLPALQDYVLTLGRHPVSEGPGPEARVYGPPRADRRYGLGVSPTKEQAVFGEGVEVGGPDVLVAVGADVILPQAVDDDQDHVGVPVGRRGVAWEIGEHTRAFAP